MSSDILGHVTKDGSSGFKVEKDRYHLYVAHGCPFAHRTIIGRKIKGLENIITMDYIDSLREDAGKSFNFSPEHPDTINGKEYLSEVYLLSHPDYTGRCTVPVLFDKQTKKIVSNSSAEILKMLNSEFEELSTTDVDLYPEELKKEIDDLNEWITPGIAGAVYRVGFAQLAHNQELYDKEVEALFHNLDKVDELLETKRYLTGPQLTDADIRLIVVLLRFDSVYYSLFKCCKRTLVSYKNLWPYLRDVYQTFGLASINNMAEIKKMYFRSPKFASFDGVVPVGPELDFNEPHGREGK
ncbi:glutathionyl-hydroquinone reductase YqjG-like [Clytia hemisphaerica]|uniref:GST N-terminal domain-containing protein n=1 Tax=Clytia hemisphaerica TaxID=252671 RepID=A0A7M5V4C2_9CNID